MQIGSKFITAIVISLAASVAVGQGRGGRDRGDWGGGPRGDWGGGPRGDWGGPGGGPGGNWGGPGGNWGGPGPGWGGPGGMPGGGWGMPGRQLTPEEIEMQMRRIDMILQQLDVNRNGAIEASEIGDNRARFMLERVVRQAGMEPTYPIPIAKVHEGAQKFFQTMGTPGAQPAAPAAGAPAAAGQQASTTPAAPAVPLVPGFGVPATSAVSVAGFTYVAPTPVAASGRFVVGGTAAAAKAGASTGSKAGASSDAPPKPEEEKVRIWAKAQLAQHDKNKSGKLEKDEWEDLQDPEQTDANHDGVITEDELAARMLAYSQKRSDSSDRAKAASQSSATGTSDSSLTSTPYRFRTAAESVKSGLPDWFAQRDANRDGMISMAEYTREWNESKVAEFGRYDLNGDGVITQDECLAATAREKGMKGLEKSTATASAAGPIPGRLGSGGGPPSGPPGQWQGRGGGNMSGPGAAGGPPAGPYGGPRPGRPGGGPPAGAGGPPARPAATPAPAAVATSDQDEEH